MTNHYTAIGFPDAEDGHDVWKMLTESGKELLWLEDFRSVLYRDPSGMEIWMNQDEEGNAMCAEPYFYGSYGVWVRPLAMFAEEIETERGRAPRFALVKPFD